MRTRVPLWASRDTREVAVLCRAEGQAKEKGKGSAMLGSSIAVSVGALLIGVHLCPAC